MVLGAADRGADVVKQRRVLQELALDGAEAVCPLRGIEQLQGESRDVPAVARVGIERRGEVENDVPALGGEVPAAPPPPQRQRLDRGQPQAADGRRSM